MSASFACTRCGTAIPEEHLETGTAISVLGKSYCAECKGQAVQDISLDELMEGNSPPPRPSPLASPQPAPPPRTPAPKPPEAKPASKAAPPSAPTPRVSSSPRNRPETKRLRISEIRRPSKAPLIAGAAVGLLAVVVTAVLVLRDPPKPGPGPGPGPTPPTPDPVSTTPDPPKPPDLREEKALAAYTTAEVLARRSEKNFDETLAAIESARGPCKGTRYEAKLEQLRNEILKEKDIVEGTKALNPLLDELKGAVTTDPQFARYAELMAKFERARELASRAAPQKISDLNALQSDYKGKYEEQAQVHYPEILEYATAMADEKRFDAALKKIETFPPQLRQSGAWRALERLKQDIERRKAGSK
jgi:hypothetical protein